MVAILVVDDSVTDRTRITGLLRKESQYELVTANNGAEALDLLKESSVDLVLTDLQMPEIDGLKLVQTMKEDHPQIPVILMTGIGSEEIAVQAMKEGAANYISKSAASQFLQETIEQVLAARVEELSNAELLKQLTVDEYELTLINNRVLMASTARFLRNAVQAVRLCPESELPRLGIAMEEALLNACLHGNLELDSKLREGDGLEFQRLAEERSVTSPWQERRVTVRASITPQQMTVNISDEGPGFDPAKLPDPTDPENLLKPHGRGVMMMRLFLDDVSWNDRGNAVTLVKNGQFA